MNILIQHAWTEAEHDLVYKTETPLAYEEKRKVGWTAPRRSGGTIFDEIWRTRHSKAR